MYSELHAIALRICKLKTELQLFDVLLAMVKQQPLSKLTLVLVEERWRVGGGSVDGRWRDAGGTLFIVCGEGKLMKIKGNIKTLS